MTVPEAIWVFDHSEVPGCGNKIRIKESDLTAFINAQRGECPTCMQPLGEPRPAVPSDW